jgi:hypothetical protein
MMKVKFNKEMLLKHRFWVLICVTAILTLAGTFYLQLYGGEDTAKAAKKYKSVISKGMKPESNPVINARLQEDADKAKKKQSEVWEQAYKDQEPMFKWAPKVEKEFDFCNGKFANEIKISKLVDEKEWPEDKENLLHGKFIDMQDNYCRIKTRKKEEKFYRTENLTITDAETNKPVNWGDEFKAHLNNKLLAINFQTGRYFADNLLQTELDAFIDSYPDLIHDVLRTVDPLDEKGNGVVQLRNWLYRSDKLPHESENSTTTSPAPSTPTSNSKDVKFIRYVEMEWDKKSKFSKEAWIAQENIWIQKEIYRIIRQTNDDISKFVGGEDKAAKGKYHFKNSSFALELNLLEDKSLSFKITNLLQRTQKLDLNFRVQMSKQGTAPIISISGLPLPPGKNYSQTIKFDPAKEAQRTGVYAVQQLLTWETAAVKRIDQITIGSIAPNDIAHSHRSFPKVLLPFDKNDLPKEPEKDSKDGIQPKGPPIGRESAPPFGPGGQGGAGGANKNPLKYGLWTDRYIEVSDQSRRIPVAVALIVDQDHVDRVLTHFNNSKLRFLETQVLVNHYAGSLAPPAAEDQKKEGGSEFRPKGIGIFPGPGREGRPIPGGPGPRGEREPSAAGDDSESNMELVIYGIMTLYQRYPPRPQTEKAPQ